MESLDIFFLTKETVMPCGPPRPAGVSGVRAIRDIRGGVTLEMPVKSPRVIAMCSRRSRHST
jgi:hypothetical protein